MHEVMHPCPFNSHKKHKEGLSQRIYDHQMVGWLCVTQQGVTFPYRLYLGVWKEKKGRASKIVFFFKYKQIFNIFF